ncbi:hypothetical protein FA15DRAFT_605139 [Coprinopsis marcescibilis]|uniref:Methyltransferase n=1 Tax=Coprinopsis marcescibilis TaxID=230819 RepID=A0A5C3KBV2_COPMA|nr:hypothetical protein FA15DRAFT_605139 [Coprinopsis marcescibilis]
MAISVDVASTVSNLTYFVPPADGTAAYQYVNADPVTGKAPNNYTRNQYTVEVENVRGKEDQYKLDEAGFQFVQYPAKHKSFEDDEEIKTEYYAESVELLKSVTGASRVVIFDHTVRRNRPDQIDDGPQKRKPLPQVHIDQTPKSADDRAHRHLPPADTPALLQKRFQIVNVWRPINNPAWDWPLACCDYRSVDRKADPLPVKLIYPDMEGEFYGVTFSEVHKWKYLRGMTPEEAVLIKCYDSVADGSVSEYTPHTAFKDHSAPADAPFRESIELRAFVFYD